jgi:hypothetical protein
MAGSGQLSLLADMAKKASKMKNTPKGARPGWTRGAKNSMMSKGFKGRNSQKGLNDEMETLQSPIMDAYMKQFSGQTPITDSLRGR